MLVISLLFFLTISTGDYPRIERREEQINTAKANFKALSRILSKCLSFQPQDRPNSQAISEFLRDIQSNDRYYPPSRRLPPQCDLGVMARSWLTEKVDISLIFHWHWHCIALRWFSTFSFFSFLFFSFLSFLFFSFWNTETFNYFNSIPIFESIGTRLMKDVRTWNLHWSKPHDD